MENCLEGTISLSLENYIQSTILKKYKNFDKAHNLQHANRVISNSLKLSSVVSEPVNISMVFTIAAYHDVGLIHGRDNHEKTSASFLLQDEKLKRWFSFNQIKIMADAVEDHRASSQNHPRSIYGKIVSDADRDIDYKTVLMRAIQYGLANYPEYTWSQHWHRTYNHLCEKYGESGYATLWIDCDYNKMRLLELQSKLNSKHYLYNDFRNVFKNENSTKNCLLGSRMVSEPVYMKLHNIIYNFQRF